MSSNSVHRCILRYRIVFASEHLYAVIGRPGDLKTLFLSNFRLFWVGIGFVIVWPQMKIPLV